MVRGLLGILVVDDFPPWRVWVRGMLQARPEWKIIGEACDGLEAVYLARELWGLWKIAWPVQIARRARINISGGPVAENGLGSVIS